MLSVTDTVIRIKNGYRASRSTITVKYSKLVQNVLEKLVTEGYIKSFEVETVGAKKSITVQLAYQEGNKSTFTDVKLASKPGQKMYVTKTSVPKVLNGLGTAIMSTTKGVMTGKEAKKNGIGGELLFTIW